MSCETKLYVDSVGVEFLLNLDRNLADVTEQYINVKKPNGSEVTWAATKYTHQGEYEFLQYLTVEDDLDMCGKYLLQPKIITVNGGTFYGRTTSITVQKRFT